uniref:Uncharacterized protein n=1 Tax=Nicotiana tabacum TaxID=4097 RepID=A0A1S4D818_TOBAC|nr:PREDICTED: uncharacterized protein LOC107826967 [Nicotiana tabacum]
MAMAEEQKKRTMEALERRFAQAKAELEVQQHKNKKISVATTTTTPVEKNGGLARQGINSSPSPFKSKANSSSISSKKGYLSFSGHPSSQDVELNNPAYLQLSHSVDENLLKNTTEITGTVNDILHDLLQHGDSAQKYMQGSKNVKLSDLQYWPCRKNQLSQCLLNADLHGALILVVQCKIAGLSGVHGIMIRETVETFGIITEDNKFQVVPKKLSVFMLQVDCWKVTLLGDKLSSRNMIT